MLAAAVSQAATLDFTGQAGQDAAAGQTTRGSTGSYTYTDVDGTGIDVTVRSSGGRISWEEGDGLGVDGYGDDNNGPDLIIEDDWGTTSDEINQWERLTVSFSEDVHIIEVGLTDIYASPDSGGWRWIADESGNWSLRDSDGAVVARGSFEAEEYRNPNGSSNWTNNGNNGLLQVPIDEIGSALKLASGNNSQYKGFSVGYVAFNPTTTTTTDVPELSAAGGGVSAALLVGIGLVATGRRRRNA
jgi:hypothetical protein